MKNGMYKPASEYGDDGIPCLRMYNIEAGAIAWRDIKRMRVTDVERVDYGLLPGDLLVNRVNSRELVGKAAVVPFGMEASVFESKNIRVRLKVDKARAKFINYQLLAGGRHHFAGNAQQVVGMASISQTQLADFPIVLASLERQDEIVAELEEQFSRLDEAVANLKRVKANLKRYKASVLKDAVEGQIGVNRALSGNAEQTNVDGATLRKRLSAERRKVWEDRIGLAKTSRYKEPRLPITGGKRELPTGWTWMTLDELSRGDRPCAYGVLQPGADLDEGVPFVRVGDINDGAVALEKLKRIDPAVAARYPRTRLEGGELLITLVGSIGRTAIAPASLAGANVARAVGVVPLSALVNPQWVEIWFRSPDQMRTLNGQAHEVARKTLNLEDVRNALVALPPLYEQDRIAREVDVRLSILDSMARDVEKSLIKAAQLRVAVLQKCFGKTSLEDER